MIAKIGTSVDHSLAACCKPGAAALTRRSWLVHLKKLETTWVFIALVFALIALLTPFHLSGSIRFTLDGLRDIAPFVLLSATVAGYLEAASADQLIGRVFSNRAVLAIAAAALFGALSPFCSCGVIPLIAALLVSGVPLAAVMAFWVSSPIMSPSMFVVTAAGLGAEFALVKVVSAVVIGLAAGYLTMFLQRFGFLATPLKAASSSACSTACQPSVPDGGVPQWRVWQDPERLRAFRRKTLFMVMFLTKWLTLAFILESLMLTFVPAEWLGAWLGSSSAWAIPLAAILGVPAYLNGFAAVPVVAGLIETGMMPGAALSFMLAGAMTSIPAAIAVFSLVRRPVFVWYVSLALFGAILAGFAYHATLAWV